jgi:hypothetical protein
MSITAGLFLLVFAVAAAGCLYVIRGERRQIQQRFSGRALLPISEVCALFTDYGASDGALVQEILEYIGGELSVEPALLRPTDRFDAELSPPPGGDFDSARSSLSLELARLAKAKNKQIDVTSIKTLGEYVAAMATVYR